MTTDKPGEVFALIPKAMAEIGAIAKTEKNKFHHYKFRGIDSIYNAFHGPLSKFGLFIVAHAVEIVSTREVRTKSEGTQLEMVLAITFRIYAPDGSYVEVRCIGTGMDSGDKAAAKAHTAAYKVLCFETFMPPIEDDSDGDRDSPEREDQQPPPPPRQQPTTIATGPIAEARASIVAWVKAHRDAAQLEPDAVKDDKFLLTVSREMYGGEGASTVARVTAMREAIAAGGFDLNTGMAKP